MIFVASDDDVMSESKRPKKFKLQFINAAAVNNLHTILEPLDLRKSSDYTEDLDESMTDDFQM